MKGYRKKSGQGRPITFRTWLTCWMAMKSLTIEEFAKILMVSTASVERWRAGRPINHHMAKLVKAFFPDAPIHGLGGPVALITQPLPTQTRSTEMYSFIFRITGFIDGLAHPAAMAKARGIGIDHHLKPKVVPVTSYVPPTTPPPHR